MGVKISMGLVDLTGSKSKFQKLVVAPLVVGADQTQNLHLSFLPYFYLKLKAFRYLFCSGLYDGQLNGHFWDLQRAI